MATIGDQIRAARQRKRWTQRQLAEAVDVNVKTVDNWENGRTSPKNRLAVLEEVLGVQLREHERDPDVRGEDESGFEWMDRQYELWKQDRDKGTVLKSLFESWENRDAG